MYSLYVDSTSGLVIGLLDSNFKWVSYSDTQEKKPSEVIHVEIYNLVKKHNLELKNMNFFFSAGPGSYTGMRLGEGIAQIIELHIKNVFSFHHFDVPRFAGIKKGFWATNAFKGQIFNYTWDEERDVFEKELVDAGNFTITNPELGFTVDNNVKGLEHLKTTKDLIKNSPETIFAKVYNEKMRQPPFYFRTLEEEFK